MDYIQTYNVLRRTYNTGIDSTAIPESDTVIYNIPFRSVPIPSEPADSPLRFDRKIYNALLKYYLRFNTYSNDYLFHSLNERDENIEENVSFNYIVVKKKSSGKANSFIFLFHGLNERSWDKYLPWAFDLVNTTGKPVLLFPLAYHMNRAPRIWSDPRLMKEVSVERMRLFPDLHLSSFANAALSIRLQFSPNRFLLSGVQTFNDIVRLMNAIRQGDHPHFHANANPDIFGYSIGAFFSEILMMSNPGNFFDDSKMFLFCGGPTLDLMNPVSKAIIDSEAALALKNFYIDTNGVDFLKDEMIASVFEQFEEGGKVFKSMLSHRKMKSYRTEKFKIFNKRCMIVPLQKDGVMPPDAVRSSFPPCFHSKIKTDDFPYAYLHENPFPVNAGFKEEVDAGFRRIFDIAGGFLS
jgi:hypothetical protein